MDLSSTIAPKSDQLNSDDLIAGPRTIRVTKVTAGSAPEQPVSIHFDGDGGKPYKPCKSMRRVLVKVWGPDGAKYAGRSMTIYRDEGVVFGGQAVGGIRISHVTGITEPVVMALTASKAKRAPFTIRPLVMPFRRELAALQDAASRGMAALETAWKSSAPDVRKALADELTGLKERAAQAAPPITSQGNEAESEGEQPNDEADTSEQSAADNGDPFGG